MNILFLSNFYPPHGIGGYELLCQQVADNLRARAHRVTVLTSTFGVPQEISDGPVHRLLALENDLYYYDVRSSLGYPRAKARDLQYLRNLTDLVKPDIIFIWGMWALGKQLAAESERIMPNHVVYYLANPWPIEPNLHQAYWDSPARRPLRRLGKRAARLPFRLFLAAEWRHVALQFLHAPCCSQALRDQLIAAGVPLKDAPVIYEGIELQRYLDQNSTRDASRPCDRVSLLYVGALVPHKGVHTAIEAVARLPENQRCQVTLTLLGKGHPDYVADLHKLVAAHELSEVVTFQNPIPRGDLPEFLGQYDILLLPSIWEEPLALIMQEGLASGLVVVGSATGGTKEIIVDGDNGLLFTAGDAVALSKQIGRLASDWALRLRLAENGRRTAAEKFDLHRMVDDLEAYLTQVAIT